MIESKEYGLGEEAGVAVLTYAATERVVRLRQTFSVKPKGEEKTRKPSV